MSIPRPSVRITLGGRTLSAAEAGLEKLRVYLGLGCHDAAEISLWKRSKFASAKTGDVVSIQLGSAGGEEDVWAGKIESAEHTPVRTVLTGCSETLALSREHTSQTFVGQRVSQIVQALCGGVAVDKVQGDAELSYYAVDHRRSVWGHLLDLATLTGSDILSVPTGGLRFAPINTLPSATQFRFGHELLDWRIATGGEGSPGGFAPHGASSEAGSEKWHWVNSDPAQGAGGKRITGSFHAKALADDLSKASAARAKRAALRGEIELTGQVSLRPGDVFQIADWESGDPGPLRALSVTHSVDGVSGFRTFARVEAA